MELVNVLNLTGKTISVVCYNVVEPSVEHVKEINELLTFDLTKVIEERSIHEIVSQLAFIASQYATYEVAINPPAFTAVPLYILLRKYNKEPLFTYYNAEGECIGFVSN